MHSVTISVTRADGTESSTTQQVETFDEREGAILFQNAMIDHIGALARKFQKDEAEELAKAKK